MAQFRKDSNKFLSDGKTIYEVNMLSDRVSPSGTLTDAFGRLRISTPFTLFDSFHRYDENETWTTSNSVSANTQHLPNESVIDLNVGTSSGQYVYRETKRVFAYQPGKSLLIMNTFVMNEQKTNVRQRVGYFNDQNGIYFENDGSGNYLVLRSYVTGSVVNTRIAQENWNIDKFDGTGYSAQQGHNATGLDITKANIFWCDIEWLGTGDVRCGFIIDGKMMMAHVFHNDNMNTTTYMTTSCLPLRYEIENTGTSASVSSMKQICSTVMSEGGYELRGRSKSHSMPISTSFRLTSVNTYYPVLSFKLHPDRLDAIVIPTDISVHPKDNGNFHYKLIYNPTIDGATWVNTHSINSSLQYNSNTSATLSGGTDLTSGYIGATTQSRTTISLNSTHIFRYQFERDGLANTSIPIVLAIGSDVATSNVWASMDWEEIT